MTAYPLLVSPAAWQVTLDQLLGTPLQIFGIVLTAVIGRWLLHRLIRTVVNRATAQHSDRLRILRGRAGEALADASGLADERYVQRTQTVGAVLRSVVTIVIATLAVLTIMATLGVPLAPLLASAGVGGGPCGPALRGEHLRGGLGHRRGGVLGAA